MRFILASVLVSNSLVSVYMTPLAWQQLQTALGSYIFSPAVAWKHSVVTFSHIGSDFGPLVEAGHCRCLKRNMFAGAFLVWQVVCCLGALWRWCRLLPWGLLRNTCFQAQRAYGIHKVLWFFLLARREWWQSDNDAKTFQVWMQRDSCQGKC